MAERIINCLFVCLFRFRWFVWRPWFRWCGNHFSNAFYSARNIGWQGRRGDELMAPKSPVNVIGHHPSQFTADSWQSWIFSDIWPHSIRPSDICASFVSFSFISESSVECGASSSVVRATAAASARASRRRHLLNTARRRGVGWRSQQTARPAEWETRPTPATRSKAMAQRQDLEARACRQKHARACSNY